MREPENAEQEEDGRGAGERWVLPYIEDPGLWPVLVVVLAALAAFLTPVLLLAIRQRHPSALIVIVLLLFGTYRAVRWERNVRGRFGGLAVVLLLVWLLAFVAGVVGTRSGML